MPNQSRGDPYQVKRLAAELFHGLIVAALPGDTANPANWPAYAALLPHAEAALRAEDTGMGRIAHFFPRHPGRP